MINTFNGDINNAEFRKGFISALVFLQEQYNGHFGMCKMNKNTMLDILNVVINNRHDILDRNYQLAYNQTTNKFGIIKE